jgi:major type 1 subunit fimbrin (pilin)
MKHIKTAIFGLALAATAGAASADQGLITFVGSVSDSTCVVSGGNGSNGAFGNFTVALDPVRTTALNAAAKTAGRKGFEVVFSNGQGGSCATATITKAHFRFVGSSPSVNIDGRMKNVLGFTGAENVDLQMLDESNAVINLTNHTRKDVTLATTGPTVIKYGVQYYATGVATAGNVRSDVIYEASYD